MSFLSNREEAVFRAWRKVPPELWSDPTIYETKSYAKIYKKIQKKGLAAIGFDKIKLFEACLSLVKERDQVEDIHVGLTERVFSLLSQHDGTLHHYDAERNAIYSILTKDGYTTTTSYYSRNSPNSFGGKLIEKIGRGSFHLLSETIHDKYQFTASGNCWQRTTRDYDRLVVYPEVQEYLIHKEKWQKIKEKIRHLAEVLPTLFEIEESHLKFKPSLIRHEERQFYLLGLDGYHNIVLNYEPVSLCLI